MFKGFTWKSGEGLPNIVKITGIESPESVKDTDAFELELYKEFDAINYVFSN